MERELLIIIIILWLLFSQVQNAEIKEPIPYVRSIHEVFSEEELSYMNKVSLCE